MSSSVPTAARSPREGHGNPRERLDFDSASSNAGGRVSRDVSNDSLGGPVAPAARLDRRRSSLAQIALLQASSSLTELSQGLPTAQGGPSGPPGNFPQSSAASSVSSSFASSAAGGSAGIGPGSGPGSAGIGGFGGMGPGAVFSGGPAGAVGGSSGPGSAGRTSPASNHGQTSRKGSASGLALGRAPSSPGLASHGAAAYAERRSSSNGLNTSGSYSGATFGAGGGGGGKTPREADAAVVNHARPEPTPGRGYREVYEEVFAEIKYELALQSSMSLDRRTKMLEPVAMRRRAELSLLQYRHLRQPPRSAEASHRTLHLCIPEFAEVPDMWTVGHVPLEPLTVLLVDEEGQVVQPWSGGVEVRAYLVNSVGDVVYERFDYGDVLAGNVERIDPRGRAEFASIRVLMASDLARGGSCRLAFVAQDWAIEPVVSTPFTVIDECRPHGSAFLYPRLTDAPIAFAVPASNKPRGSNRIAQTSPIHVAVAKGNVELCRLLVEKGDSVNVVAQDNLTPFHVAAFLDNLGIIKLGVENRADVNLPCSHGFTALHYAIIGGAERTARALLGHPATNKEAIGLSGWHALHLAAQTNLRAVAVSLIDSGCEVDVTNFVDKQTPLHIAAFYGRENLVFLLLDSGANPVARSRRDWTPLHLAVLGGNAPTVEALLSNRSALAKIDARIEGSLYTPLHLACLRARDDIVSLLLARGASAKTSAAQGWSTAHLAAVSGSAAVYDAVCQAGGDPKGGDSSNYVSGGDAAAGGAPSEIGKLLAPEELKRVFIDMNLETMGPHADIVPDVLDKISSLSHVAGTGTGSEGEESSGGKASKRTTPRAVALQNRSFPSSPMPRSPLAM